MGFVRGRTPPCVFHHPKRDLTEVVHGDNVLARGLRKEQGWYEQRLALHIEIGDKSRLGTGPDDQKRVRSLNRMLGISDDKLLYEADPRHVELLAKYLGLVPRKPMCTPGVKDRDALALVDDDAVGEQHDVQPGHKDQLVSGRSAKTADVNGCPRNILKHVTRSNDDDDVISIPVPYCKMYGHRPSAVSLLDMSAAPTLSHIIQVLIGSLANVHMRCS